MRKELLKKYNHLLEILSQYDSAVIAYSGGVDSSFLLHAADESSIKKIYAVSVKSGLLDDSEIEDIKNHSSGTRAELHIIEEDLLADKNIRSNPPDRCYHCKKSVLGILKKFSGERKISIILEGSNSDDLKDYRPGFKAVTEMGIISPLMIAGLTKSEIREISAEKQLTFSDKKSSPCYATRIAHNEELTREKLDSIKKAEKYLSGIVRGNIRVRLHGNIARIETDTENFKFLIEPEISGEILKNLTSLGFKFVALDLAGYRMGSMNQIPEDTN